jgi:hypothetical protein
MIPQQVAAELIARRGRHPAYRGLIARLAADGVLPMDWTESHYVSRSTEMPVPALDNDAGTGTDCTITPATCYRTVCRIVTFGSSLGSTDIKQWANWGNVQRAHRIMMDGAIASRPDYPDGRYVGRGIVMAGGGKYWVSSYVSAMMARDVCHLPIQVWYLGDRGEGDLRFQTALAEHGIECIDADKVRREHPHRILNGFELKLFSSLYSPFEEVLYLDADNYPIHDPSMLFDDRQYQKSGGIFWPDLPMTNKWTNWSRAGVAKYGPDCGWETGQFVLHKRKAWPIIQLSRWFDEHSDFYYHCDYGDKGSHRLAWAKYRVAPAMFRLTPKWHSTVFIQDGPDVQPLFIHRCRNKFSPAGSRFYTPQTHGTAVKMPSLPREDRAWDLFAEAIKIWQT